MAASVVQRAAIESSDVFPLMVPFLLPREFLMVSPSIFMLDDPIGRYHTFEFGPSMMPSSLAAYAGEAGVAVDEETVGRFHVVSALEHFAFVSWDAPRFPHIIAWATAAVRALTPDWVA